MITNVLLINNVVVSDAYLDKCVLVIDLYHNVLFQHPDGIVRYDVFEIVSEINQYCDVRFTEELYYYTKYNWQHTVTDNFQFDYLIEQYKKFVKEKLNGIITRS